MLLLDRARFPRDKPCGGGLTGRALRLLPFSVDPVVEDATDTFELRLALRAPLRAAERRAARRDDAALAARRVPRRAGGRGGSRLPRRRARRRRRGGDGGVEVRAGGRTIHGDVLDRRRRRERRHGAGARARARGRARRRARGQRAPRGRRRASATPAGWCSSSASSRAATAGSSRRATTSTSASAAGASTGPQLRDHLRRLCVEHGLPWDARRVAARSPAADAARADAARAGRRALVVGDAAGLVDPVSGDGMYEAFLSGKLASDGGARPARRPRARASRATATRSRRLARAARRGLVGDQGRARPLAAALVRARAASRRSGAVIEAVDARRPREPARRDRQRAGPIRPPPRAGATARATRAGLPLRVAAPASKAEPARLPMQAAMDLNALLAHAVEAGAATST